MMVSVVSRGKTRVLYGLNSNPEVSLRNVTPLRATSSIVSFSLGQLSPPPLANRSLQSLESYLY